MLQGKSMAIFILYNTYYRIVHHIFLTYKNKIRLDMLIKLHKDVRKVYKLK